MDGGGNVDVERMSQLEREVTGISTDVKYLVKAVDGLNQVVATKTEVSALERRVTTLEDKDKNSKVNAIATVSAIGAVGSVVVAVWAVLH